jgi:hypothetical protein
VAWSWSCHGCSRFARLTTISFVSGGRRFPWSRRAAVHSTQSHHSLIKNVTWDFRTVIYHFWYRPSGLAVYEQQLLMTMHANSCVPPASITGFPEMHQ